jgi:hypothetical protein
VSTVLRSAAVLVAVLPCVTGCALVFGIHDLDDGGPIAEGGVHDGAAPDGGARDSARDSPPDSARDSARDASGDRGPAANIGLVQSTARNRNDEASDLEVTFTNDEVAGDLNIVVIGWYDDHPNSIVVTDSTKANTYHQAVGIRVLDAGSDSVSQAIFYASGIKPSRGAGPTTVTVSWTMESVFYPDVQILEYAGVSTLDESATASGTGEAILAMAGPVVPMHDPELLFAAGTSASCNDGFVHGGTGEAWSHVDNDGNIAEDRIVSSRGSYYAEASQGDTAPWVLQVAGFY